MIRKVLRQLILSPLLLIAVPAGAADWSETIESVSSGIVSIRVDGTRAFDTEWNQSSQATGFVVDAERGLILTNRHVVMPGPVVAEAIFLNHEEVPLTPVYRDPVHDFGLYSYDPDKLRFIQPAELELFPGGAQVGREIRVIGNDAGEQLSILAGTIARLDREAPSYGRGNYNDFNTFYIQAASGTSGGSSGSPVIDIQGRAVALNAGARSNAQSSFFLPLHRVVRAVEALRAGEPVTRGTLQTVFVHRAFDELRRLGLREDTEAATRERFPDTNGMLMVDQVVPGGPGDGVLESGDILVSLEGEPLVDFLYLETVLDTAVGESVSLTLERGGVTRELELGVQDLHAITPARYLEFGGAVVHDLSYQQARSLNVPVSGVYVANAGYVLANAAIPRGAVIRQADGETIETLDDLVGILADKADRERITLRYVSFDDASIPDVRVVRMDRRWFPAQVCVRDDDTGLWPCEALPEVAETVDPEPVTTRFPERDDPRVDTLQRSLALVEYDIPYPVSGVTEPHYYGTGLVVDAERGLVLADRNTVPIALGDATLTFAGSVEIPAEVHYVHPLHNLVLLRYDPAHLGDTPVRSAVLRPEPLHSGDPLWVVGLRPDHRVQTQRTEVATVDPVNFPLSTTFRFRDSNLETISLVNAPEQVDGVLADEQGRVMATWSSFAYQGGRSLNQSNAGIPIDLAQDMLAVATDPERVMRSLGVELSRIPLASAREFGLTEPWARRVERENGHRQVLQVERLVAESPAEASLEVGDLLLALDGELVTDFREVERASQAESVVVTVMRDGEEQEFELGTVPLSGLGVDRVLVWAGALLQDPHRALAAQRGIDQEGVFVARYYFGSPANRFNLHAGRLIVEVDGEPTPDLDSFIAAIADLEDREAVRIKTMQWDRRMEVITLKVDQTYWPAYLVERTEAGWRRRDLE